MILVWARLHRFSILAGHEVSDSGGDGLKASGTYYPANFTKENAFAMINQYDGTQGVGQFSSSVSIPGRILSFFSRLNYNLLDRYLLTVTFRADGSSKFSPNNRWGYFPAAALGWRMSEESFLKDIEWLDNLKLRVSYGQVGNDGISSSLLVADLVSYNGREATRCSKQYASAFLFTGYRIGE